MRSLSSGCIPETVTKNISALCLALRRPSTNLPHARINSLERNGAKAVYSVAGGESLVSYPGTSFDAHLQPYGPGTRYAGRKKIPNLAD